MSEAGSLAAAMRSLPRLRSEGGASEASRTAAERVLHELQRLAKLRGSAPVDADDVASTVFLKLWVMQNLLEGITTDEEARAYLSVAVRNELTSIERSRKRLTALPEFEQSGDRAEPEPGGLEDHLAATETRTELEAARVQLFGEIVPSIAARKRADGAKTFSAVLERLRAVERGEIGVIEWVADDARLDAHSRDTAEWDRARNRIDQSVSRAIREILVEIEERFSTGTLTSARRDALRKVTDLLRPALRDRVGTASARQGPRNAGEDR